MHLISRPLEVLCQVSGLTSPCLCPSSFHGVTWHLRHACPEETLQTLAVRHAPPQASLALAPSDSAPSTQCCAAWESPPAWSPHSPQPRALEGACLWMSTTTRRGCRTEKAREAESGEKPKGDEVSDWKGSQPGCITPWELTTPSGPGTKRRPSRPLEAGY